MEKVNINYIMKQFDTYVQNYLEKKDADHQQEEITPLSDLDQYFQSMEKRLKLRTVANYQKFQNLLTPMKKLKSFVSIKTFLRQLNVKSVKKNQIIPNKQLKRKLQYQSLRGGYYMQKIQNHLKQNHLKRKLNSQAETLLRQLQSNPTQRNQYTNWIENVLSKISLKQQAFFKIQTENQFQQKQNFSKQLNTHGKLKKNKSSRQQFLKRKSLQDKQQKNFKKVGDFLSERLRKILLDKYGSNKSKRDNRNIIYTHNKQNLQFTIPSQTTQAKKTCRTAQISKRIRIETQGNMKRAQTSEVKNRNSQNLWKSKFNCKINDILNQADIQVKKGKQQIAKLNMFKNNFEEQACQLQI